ncbi:MAG: HD domain-containing protein [Solirubrobacteraceae bacterium]|nr:HD domain-containing protein [Solirubrobacteraceae bacterium]
MQPLSAPPSAPEDNPRLDAAVLAIRSGGPLTICGITLLVLTLLLNLAQPVDQRIPIPGEVWGIAAVAFLITAALAAWTEYAVRHRRERIRVEQLFQMAWYATIINCAALAAGILFLPEFLVQFGSMYVMVVLYVGYFYSRRNAATSVMVAAVCMGGAVALAPHRAVELSAHSPVLVIPLIGTVALAGLFIASVRLARDRSEERTRLVSALGLARALDYRDAGTGSHSEHVAAYAVAMARELGLPGARVERVRLAGLLHDVGKIGIPDALLLKPGALDDDEWALMRRHPEIGARMLDSALLGDVRAWVLAHHERPDGRGYPLGLTLDEIPLEARILAVADAFEAMTADRVYRAAMPAQDAWSELLRCAGTQFDPAVVEAFGNAFERGDILVGPAAPALAAA